MAREVRIERRGKAGLDAAEKLYLTRDADGNRMIPEPTGAALEAYLRAPALAAATSAQQIGEQVEASAAAFLDEDTGPVSKRVRTDTDDQGLDADEQANARTNIAAAAADELAAAQARIAELEAIEDLRNELYPISEILVLGSPVLAANNPIRTGA